MNLLRPKKSEAGFSMLELLLGVVILAPIMAAAFSFFSVGASQHASEQSNIDALQEARAGLDTMATEIGQAGSHRDVCTTLSGAISAASTSGVRAFNVNSTAGYSVGDYVFVDVDDSGTSASQEEMRIEAVTANSISGILAKAHASGAPVCSSPWPFQYGVIRPTGLGNNDFQNVTTLQFFGDITGNMASSATDPNIYYVEYVYDSTNNQITRSATPITQTTKATAVPLIRNLVPGSVQMTVTSDQWGIITSVNLSMSVRNTVRISGHVEDTQLSTRVSIPSALSAAVITSEISRPNIQAVNKFPPTPANVNTLAGITEGL